ncbi:MAG: SGNH/GDSL hydrolase family protein [bacterium]
MIFFLKSILIYLGIITIIVFTADILRMYLLAQKSKILIKNVIPFERHLSNPQIKILVLGDSTAYGTGSETSELTTAGRLGALYPEASLTNLAVNGLRLEGLLKIVSTLDTKEHYSLILVQIGANDIIRLTTLAKIKEEVKEMVAELSKKTDSLIILHSGDIGEAKFFPFYLKPILSYRSYRVRDIYIKIAKEYRVHYIDLIDSPAAEFLRTNPDLYYADDKLHLSGAGYGLWFNEIKKVL